VEVLEPTLEESRCEAELTKDKTKNTRMTQSDERLLCGDSGLCPWPSEFRISGVETRGSGDSMNRGPELLG